MSVFMEKLKKIYERDKNLSNPPEYVYKIKRILELDQEIKRK